jgi:hypothetical protein
MTCPTKETAPEVNRPAPEAPHEAEVQRILRRTDLAFRAFILCGLLVCGLVVLAMLLLWK